VTATRRGRGPFAGWGPGRSLLVIVVAIACTLTVSAIATLAVFSDAKPVAITLSAGRIFPGTRTTSGFVVHDTSGGGTAVDRTSPFAVPGDGISTPTSSWTTSFATNRYLQFDLSAPLPAGLGTTGVAFRLTISSSSPSGTVCSYVNVRRISDDASLATYGSPASPVGCTTGTGFATLVVSLPVVASSDAANDLRVRVYGRDSAGAGSVVDEAVVVGSTPYASFTLYPVRFTDAANATPVSAPWGLDGP